MRDLSARLRVRKYFLSPRCWRNFTNYEPDEKRAMSYKPGTGCCVFLGREKSRSPALDGQKRWVGHDLLMRRHDAQTEPQYPRSNHRLT